MKDARHALRRELRQRRARIDAHTRRTATTQIIQRLQRHPAFLRASCVALYSAAGSELDVWPLIHTAWKRGKTVCLPRVRGRAMNFACVEPNDSLRVGAFGVRQPTPRARRVSLRTIDLVIAPLVGFDNHRNRLGQGGGYYDRTLACRRHGRLRRPLIIGAAFGVQRVASLDTEPWDVPLDAVIHDTITTETH